jgi:hypothetical protein
MQASEETWFALFKAKYMPDGNFFNSRSMGTSRFSQELHKVEHLFKCGALHRVKDGKKTSFWEDVWCAEVPLKIQFPEIFKMCRLPKVWVSDCWDSEGWDIPLR